MTPLLLALLLALAAPPTAPVSEILRDPPRHAAPAPALPVWPLGEVD